MPGKQKGADLQAAPVSDKMRALLAIAAAVQEGGLKVTPEGPAFYAMGAQAIVEYGYTAFPAHSA